MASNGGAPTLVQFLSSRGRRLLFLLIVFQLPLFRAPCRAGTCEAPLHVMLSQLQASVALPPPLVSALLFPGALLRNALTSFQTKAPFVHPSLSTVLEEYNMAAAVPGEEGEASAPVYRMEVVVASYLLVAGSIQALFQPARMTFMGCLVFLFAWSRNAIMGKEDPLAPELFPAFIFFFGLAVLALPIGLPKRKQVKVQTVGPKKKTQ